MDPVNIISQKFITLSDFWNISGSCEYYFPFFQIFGMFLDLVNVISQGFPILLDFWNIFGSYELFRKDFLSFQIFEMFLDPINFILQEFPVLSNFWNISGPCERNFARISCLFRVLEYFWILILQEFSILSDF